MVKLIKDTFGIESEILLQKFDKEWQEFIDLDGNAVVEDKAKFWHCTFCIGVKTM